MLDADNHVITAAMRVLRLAYGELQRRAEFMAMINDSSPLIDNFPEVQFIVSMNMDRTVGAWTRRCLGHAATSRSQMRFEHFTPISAFIGIPGAMLK